MVPSAGTYSPVPPPAYPIPGMPQAPAGHPPLVHDLYDRHNIPGVMSGGVNLGERLPTPPVMSGHSPFSTPGVLGGHPDLGAHVPAAPPAPAQFAPMSHLNQLPNTLGAFHPANAPAVHPYGGSSTSAMVPGSGPKQSWTPMADARLAEETAAAHQRILATYSPEQRAAYDRQSMPIGHASIPAGIGGQQFPRVDNGLPNSPYTAPLPPAPLPMQVPTSVQQQAPHPADNIPVYHLPNGSMSSGPPSAPTAGLIPPRPPGSTLDYNGVALQNNAAGQAAVTPYDQWTLGMRKSVLSPQQLDHANYVNERVATLQRQAAQNTGIGGYGGMGGMSDEAKQRQSQIIDPLLQDHRGQTAQNNYSNFDRNQLALGGAKPTIDPNIQNPDGSRQGFNPATKNGFAPGTYASTVAPGSYAARNNVQSGGPLPTNEKFLAAQEARKDRALADKDARTLANAARFGLSPRLPAVADAETRQKYRQQALEDQLDQTAGNGPFKTLAERNAAAAGFGKTPYAQALESTYKNAGSFGSGNLPGVKAQALRQKLEADIKNGTLKNPRDMAQVQAWIDMHPEISKETGADADAIRQMLRGRSGPVSPNAPLPLPPSRKKSNLEKFGEHLPGAAVGPLGRWLLSPGE